MPTIPIEESDYAAGSGALAGDRVFKNTVPATTLREQSANTLWHGLRSLVKQEQVSGDLTAANYAAELAAGFVNMSKAIRRAARRNQAGEVAIWAMNSDPFDGILTKDVFVYEIDPGSSSYDGGLVYIQGLDAANDRRVILVINASGSLKVVGSYYDATYASMQEGEACYFYGKPSGSGETLWIPIGKEIINHVQGVIDVEIRSSVNGLLGSTKLYWEIRHKTAYVTIFGIPGPTAISTSIVTITAVNNDPLPIYLDSAAVPSGTERWLPCRIRETGISQAGFIGFIGVSGSRKMQIFNSSADPVASGSFRFYGATMSYPLA